LNDGDGNPYDSLAAITIESKTDSTTSQDRTAALALGDLNGDGSPDLVVGNAQGASNRVYLNNGSGLFELADAVDLGAGWDTAGKDTSSVALGDIDGDTFRDVVVGIAGAGNATRVYKNKGLDPTGGTWAGFNAPVEVAAPNAGVVCSPPWIGTQVASRTLIGVATLEATCGVLNTGVFAQAGGQVHQSKRAVALAAGDVDRNGFVDLIVGVAGANNHLYRNNGETSGVWSGFAAGADIDGAFETKAILLVDLDTDGDLDVIEGVAGTARRRSSRVNRGLTSKEAPSPTNAWLGFSANQPLTSGGPTTVSALSVGDVNLDGNVDLVTAIHSGEAPNRVHLNDEGGNLGAGVALGVVYLDLPRGPYIKVRGTDVAIVVAEQRISGTFEFVRARPERSAHRVVNIPAAEIDLADGLATVNITDGSLLITNAGVAARLIAAGRAGSRSVNGLRDPPQYRMAPVILVDTADRIPAGPHSASKARPLASRSATSNSRASSCRVPNEYRWPAPAYAGGQRNRGYDASGQPLFGGVSVTNGQGPPDPSGS
jgi:hypothetical protein